MITQSLYDSETLLGVYYDSNTDEVPNFWRQFFPTMVTSEDEWIDFSQIGGNRKLAPLVTPTSQGRPIYSRTEKLVRVKPAYYKPKDPVTAAHMIRRRAGLGEFRPRAPLTPQQRHDATVNDVMLQHREAIERSWEWLAAKAILDGKVTLTDDGYPTTEVDFERAADHTITLAPGSQWGETGVSIVSDTETWIDRIESASFGGPVSDLVCGSKAWSALRADAEVRELMKTEVRNTSGTSFDLGPNQGGKVQFKGFLNQNLRVWYYADWYEDAAGNVVPFMDSRDVVLVGRGVEGVSAFGAILDKQAMRAMPVFPKMWDEEDPSATMIMTQSAPLMIPVNPNNTLRARVVA